MRRSSILDHGSVAQCSLSLTLSSTVQSYVQRYTFPKKCASSSAQVRRPVRRRLDRSPAGCCCCCCRCCCCCWVVWGPLAGPAVSATALDGSVISGVRGSGAAWASRRLGGTCSCNGNGALLPWLPRYRMHRRSSIFKKRWMKPPDQTPATQGHTHATMRCAVSDGIP